MSTNIYHYLLPHVTESAIMMHKSDRIEGEKVQKIQLPWGKTVYIENYFCIPTHRTLSVLNILKIIKKCKIEDVHIYIHCPHNIRHYIQIRSHLFPRETVSYIEQQYQKAMEFMKDNGIQNCNPSIVVVGKYLNQDCFLEFFTNKKNENCIHISQRNFRTGLLYHKIKSFI